MPKTIALDDEDETLQEINIEVPRIEEEPGDEDIDPFLKNADELKALHGVSSNRKRGISTLQKRFDGKEGASSDQLEEEVITGYNAFDVVTPPHNLDYLARIYEVSSPHYSSINAKVSNIVGLGYDFIESPTTRRKLDNTSDKDALDKKRKSLAKAKDDMHDLIDSLNQEDTFQEVLTKVWKDYEATGNGYIEVGRIRTGPNKGQVGYVGHIPSVSMRVRRKRDGYVQIISSKVVFFRNFNQDNTNPITTDNNTNEIIHIKKYSPAGGNYYGVPDIIAARQALAGNEFAARFNLEYFENKAVPRHLIIIKGATLGRGSLKPLMEMFETGLKGKNHRSLVIPLPGDTADGRKVEFKIEAIDASITDASFEKYRKGNLNEILMAHRVPISKIGLAEGVSLAVARDADKTFKEQVCQPEQRNFEKKLNRIIKTITDLFLLKLNEMSLTDENTQSQIDERRIKTGTETANEQRTKRGMPGHEKGDELVDLNAKDKIAAQSAEAASQGNRARDANRSANQTDNAGEGRNPKGEGRTTP